MTPFERLHPALRYHIVNSLGWPELRPTQRDAIEPILAGQDVLLLAPTAGGKTEAAVLPVLSRVASEGWRGLSVIYVCPLKALINNIAPRLQLYASFLGMRAAVWHGDVSAAARRRITNDAPELLLTTPESLEAMLISVRLDHVGLLGAVRTVIVDELHAFAGDDRGWHLKFLLARLEHLVGHPVQRIGLSATVGNPEDLLAWLAPGRGGQVIGPAHPPTSGDVTVDYVGSVSNAITVISRLHRGERRLVFADSRSRVEEIAGGLMRLGVRTFVSHASLSADERRRAEAAFTQEPDCVIVATSTLELGLDVGDLDRVVQVGSPATVASFLQRMGRTGRRPGALRNCLFLTTDDEEFLTALAICTLWQEGFVEDVVAPALPAHLYAQQVMALTLQEGGMTRRDLGAWLGNAIDCVPPDTRDAVLAHMMSTGILAEDAGVLGLGARGEREFGRRYFSDLVVAFSSPMVLTVRHGIVDLGTVQPASLARRPGDAAPILLLGGRSWKVVGVNWAKRLVDVVAAQSGGRSRWLGGGRPLSFDICKAQEQIVAGRTPGCTLSNRAKEHLDTLRDDMQFLDGHRTTVTSNGVDRTVIWLFAGGSCSLSIANALRSGGFLVSRSDQVSVVVRSGDIAAVTEALAAIEPSSAVPDVPEDLQQALKFGLCLPQWVGEAVLRARMAVPQTVSAVLTRGQRQVLIS